MSTPQIGSRIGNYQILEPIGHGGMGVVYAAIQLPLNRRIALKILSPGAEDLASRNRMLREMKIASRLRHPRIVEIIDGGVSDTVPFIAMELLVGTTLDLRLKAGPPFTVSAALELALQIAEGLEILHDHEVVHRDLKPSNVFLTESGAKLIDFGLARSVDSTILTRTGAILGTPLYTAPEVLASGTATRQSDLWAFGCILYELLTGRHPINSNSPGNWVQKVLNQPFIPPVSVHAMIPPAVSDFCLALLDRDPAKRDPHGCRLTAALRRLSESAILFTPGKQRVGVRRGIGPWWILPLGLVVTGVVLATMSRKSAVLAPVRGTPTGSPHLAISTTNVFREPVFSTWRLVEPHRAVLEAGGRTAQSAVTTVANLTSFELGPSPGSWSFWVKLGHFLEDGATDGSVSRWPSTHNGPVVSDSHLLATHSLRTAEGTSRELHGFFSTAIRLLETSPDDGHAWMLLGYLLEKDGLLQQSTRAYALGLRHTRAFPTSGCHSIFQMAWIRALGPALPTEWEKFVAGQRYDHHVWKNLYQALRDDEPEMLYKMLVDHGRRSRRAYEARRTLILYFIEVREDLHEARKLLTDLEVGARPEQAPDRLHWYLSLCEGRIADARNFLRRIRLNDEILILQSLCEGQEPERLPKLPLGEKARCEQLQFFLKLERGDLIGAERLAKRICSTLVYDRLLPRFKHGGILIDLLGAGCRERWVIDSARRMLLRQKTDWKAWFRAAGTLSKPAERTMMESLLAERARSWPDSGYLALTRALWLSRSGKIAESLECWRKLNPAELMSGESAEAYCEVPARALFTSPKTSAAELVVPLAKSSSVPSSIWSDFWQAVCRGNRTAAAAIATTISFRQPSSVLATLVQAWCRTSQASTTSSSELARLQALARFHGHGIWLLKELSAAQ
jgi:hypothetical protein